MAEIYLQFLSVEWMHTCFTLKNLQEISKEIWQWLAIQGIPIAEIDAGQWSIKCAYHPTPNNLDLSECNLSNLDLSGCDLSKVPDAIYVMLKSVPINKCTMAHNMLTKIPSKFPSNFTKLTGM